MDKKSITETAARIAENLFGFYDHADFSNGVVAHGADEGEVLARRRMRELKKEMDSALGSLRKAEEREKKLASLLARLLVLCKCGDYANGFECEGIEGDEAEAWTFIYRIEREFERITP